MFFRKKSTPPAPQPTITPGNAKPAAGRHIGGLTTINVGLTALASIGPRRFRPHAQAALAMIAAAQALWTLIRKSS